VNDDCMHVEVTYDPHYLEFPDRFETVHWFQCGGCRALASFVTRVPVKG
jgi:hypothetical protein